MKPLSELREAIEAVDQQMLELFIKRMELSKAIGEIKKEQKLPIYDATREKALFDKQKSKLNDAQMWPYFESFYTKLMQLSKDIQR